MNHDETPAVQCTRCGARYEMPGITYDDLRAEGVVARRVHGGNKAVPGLCPEHSGVEPTEEDDDG